MRQALHILRKDVRHLWKELFAALLLIAAFCFVGARRALWLDVPGTERTAAWTLVTLLLPLSWWILIARLIHEEALPGNSQFWITRPYDRKSLLGAKLLFIFVFINLPMLIADVIILHAYGLPVAAEWPGLLWAQVLLTVIFLLPILILSAVTTGFVQLLIAILVPCLAVLLVTIVGPDLVLALPSGYGWINSYVAFVLIAVAAAVVLIWQYRRLGTALARSFVVVAGILILFGAVFFPWPVAFRIQSWLSKQRLDPSAVQVSLDSKNSWLNRAAVQGDGDVLIELPVAITDLPAGMSAKAEGFSLELRAPDGTARLVNQMPLNYLSEVNQQFSVKAIVDGAFYRTFKDEPLALRAKVYLTLFGNRQVARIPFGNRLAPVPRVGVCAASQVRDGHSYFVVCNSPFRRPPVMVSFSFVEFTDNTLQNVWTALQTSAGISYSPLPATPGLDPVSQEFTLSAIPVPMSGAVVETQEPLAHIERTFQIANLRLANLGQRALSASR